MTKILLLGVGRWGANHLRVLHSLPIELFVCDTNVDRLELPRKLGVKQENLGSDYRQFIDKIEGVVVVTPAQTHFSICQEFLTAGKDVFVEKPMTLISEEAKALTKLADAGSRILQVGHIFRFDPATQWLHAAINQNQFGEIRMLRSNFSGFKRPRNDSGIMFADAIHFVDLFNYLLGSTPARVHGVLHDFLGRGMDDASLLSLEYTNGKSSAWGIVEANYFVPGKMREVCVIGEKMTAVCDYNVAQYKIKTFENHHEKEGHNFKAVEGALHQIECPPEEPLLSELRAFVLSVETRKKPIADGAAGIDSVRVLEAALESARTGRTVELK